MSRSRVIRWDAPVAWRTITGKVREFFGPSCEYSTESSPVIAVTMPMAESFAHHPNRAREDGDGLRCVEVYDYGEECHVVTRGADQLTNIVADGLATHLAWYYRGVVLDGVGRHEFARFAKDGVK